MQISYQWIKEYVDFDYTPEELAHELTMAGFADEGKQYLDKEISKVVVGKIISIQKHPDADKLQICQIDVGQEEKLQIVTGAQNIKVGDVIPVSLVGARLPGGVKIKKGKLRGVESCGMLCSGQELNMDKKILPPHQQDGILILPSNLPLGQDIREALGLNDVLIDLDVTGNRPDCLNMVGIAREVAALTKQKLRLPEAKVAEDPTEKIENLVKIKVEATDLCPRYAARVVKNIKIKESPLWLQRKVQAAGMRPINNIVDITNLILLELGQPLHAFDLNYLAGREIIVRRAQAGEKMVTLDEQERNLTQDMLVIADQEKAVAIAGVMGGLNSEVKEDTTTVLIEAANFNAISVRKTSKALGLRSEASNRFEKGLDPNLVDLALERAAALMAELGEGQVVSGKLDYYPLPVQPKSFTMRPERIRALVGANLKDEEIVDILNRLEIATEKDGVNYKVIIPTFRQDLNREADLVEEVARIYGFDKIEITPLSGVALQGGKSPQHDLEDKIKQIMLSSGLNEVITYSFINSKSFDWLGLEEDNPLRSAIALANPLTEEQNVMRTTMLPGLLQVVGVNLSKQVKHVEIFELGAVYLPESLPLEKLPEEKNILAAAVTGKTVKTIWGDQEELDFFYLKGIIENLFTHLGIADYTFAADQRPYLHPGRSAVIKLKDQEVGLIGEVHPDTAENYQINQRVYVFEIKLEQILAAANLIHKYQQLPKYPAIARDLALVLPETVAAQKVEEVMATVGKGIIEDITLFDVYYGGQVADGYKSLAYSLTYRSPEKTLTDEEVNSLQEKIIARLAEETGASLRG